MVARSFASEVIQVPGTLEPIANTTEQVNEPIHTSTAIASTYPAPEDFATEAPAPAEAPMTEGLTLQAINTSEVMNNIMAQANEDAEPPALAQRRTGWARQPTKWSVEAAATAQMQKKKVRKAWECGISKHSIC